jgi:hypothetical protein
VDGMSIDVCSMFMRFQSGTSTRVGGHPTLVKCQCEPAGSLLQVQVFAR